MIVKKKEIVRATIGLEDWINDKLKQRMYDVW